MKKVLLGIIIGTTLSLTTSVFASSANQFILTKAAYPIFINNVEYEKTSLPVLNYNGNTYVPLKTFGEMVQKKVTWNTALQKVEISQPCSYLDESVYYGEELELVKLVNLATRYFNEHREKEFQELINGEDLISYGVWNNYESIVALGNVTFGKITNTDASLTVWHSTIFKDDPYMIKENSTIFVFSKTDNGWEIFLD